MILVPPPTHKRIYNIEGTCAEVTGLEFIAKAPTPDLAANPDEVICVGRGQLLLRSSVPGNRKSETLVPGTTEGCFLALPGQTPCEVGQSPLRPSFSLSLGLSSSPRQD